MVAITIQKWVWENKWEDRGRWATRNAFSARQDGSLASTSYLADPKTKKHMNNDALILGFNFEPKDEGIRYMKHNKNVISFLLAIQWLSQIW